MKIKHRTKANCGFSTSILIPVVGGFLLTSSIVSSRVSTVPPDQEQIIHISTDSQSNQVDNQETTNTSAQILFNNLINEHLSLFIGALRSSYDNRSDLESILKVLDNNSLAIADTIANIYGPDASTEFLDIWRSHISYLVNYSNAIEKNDSAGRKKALEEIDTFDSRLTNYLLQLNSDISYTDINSTLSDYTLTLRSIIDAYSQENYGAFYLYQREVTKYAGSLSTMMARSMNSRNG